MLKVELDKPPIGSEKQVKPKWKLRITVLSPTHLIKAQPLNEFNQHSPIIKLSKGGTKNALIVDFTLPEFIGAPILYGYGWLNARLYVAALNVTSRGFFFWNTKQDTYKFYDKIWDLEKNAELSIRLAQEIKLDWPKAQQTLDAQELHLSRMVVDYFMDVYNTPDTVFVQHYLHGLAMLAKSDIHLRLEVQMLAHFFNVLETAMKKGSENADFKDDLFTILAGFLPERTNFERVIGLATDLKNGKPIDAESITLTEVYSLKNYCDILLLTYAYRHRSKDDGAILGGITE
jgi:hypothetical protein